MKTISEMVNNKKDEQFLTDDNFSQIYKKGESLYYFRTWLKKEFSSEIEYEFMKEYGDEVGKIRLRKRNRRVNRYRKKHYH